MMVVVEVVHARVGWGGGLKGVSPALTINGKALFFPYYVHYKKIVLVISVINDIVTDLPSHEANKLTQLNF